MGTGFDHHNHTSPKTGLRLGTLDLVPNNLLKYVMGRLKIQSGEHASFELFGDESEQQIFQKHFKCSITQKFFKDPVVASDGRTYERESVPLLQHLGASVPG